MVQNKGSIVGAVVTMVPNGTHSFVFNPGHSEIIFKKKITFAFCIISQQWGIASA